MYVEYDSGNINDINGVYTKVVGNLTKPTK